MSISDEQGRVLGGHVSPGCVVRTTAEVLLGLLPDMISPNAGRPDRIRRAARDGAQHRLRPVQALPEPIGA